MASVSERQTHAIAPVQSPHPCLSDCSTHGSIALALGQLKAEAAHHPPGKSSCPPGHQVHPIRKMLPHEHGCEM